MKRDDDPPLCQDCRHFADTHCYHPDLMEFDPIRGRRSIWAHIERKEIGSRRKCGFHGKLFEPRPPKTALQKLMPVVAFTLILALMASCTALVAHADTLSGAARVHDGDTVIVSGERVRLVDIDAPERKQKCPLDLMPGVTATYNCGEVAHQALTKLADGKFVACHTTKRDKYRRWLASCWHQGMDIGLMMVRLGWAVPYRDCVCADARLLAEEAKAAKRGLWAEDGFEMPWDWRKKK